ncbi:MAG: M20/M25/M40 family metallo-hydrolase [Planctomycetota bacterium]|jgi:acetylornithine deacetylase|nr:M20/M25/M40 family metallo-hydrolase [Planctomycetota bacterium]
MADGGDSLTGDLVDWIEIPSVTGAEGDYGDALGRSLEAAGFSVERQVVQPGRFNLLARAGVPRLVFCTHLDTVPPFFGSRVDADFIHGRGSCDAKGQAAVMLEAGRRLLAAGEERIGFLFTVGEEVDSIGAAHANAELADPWEPRWVVIGEPTDGRFVRAHKGIYAATLRARGVAGHSSQDCGPSAVHELVRCTHGLLGEAWGEHPVFGRGSLNLGEIEGGLAPNVVAAEASARLLVRAVEEPERITERIGRHLGEHVTLDAGGYACYAPVEFHVPARSEGDVVAFGTDAPHLPRWGTPLLFGPGSIRDAHTDHERVSRRELRRGVEEHVRLARELLADG